jgi:arginine/lysine/ornithine decarboxylase
LLSSLDAARKQIALKGKEMIKEVVDLSKKCRREIKSISGLELFEPKSLSDGNYIFDITKIVVNIQQLGISGYEAEKILRDKYKIQVELSDLYNVIFLISIGDSESTINYLINSLKNLSSYYNATNIIKYSPPWPSIPPMSVSPSMARLSETKTISLKDAVGEISAETIMAYPPGIPIVCPGEYITSEIVDYVNILKCENADLHGTQDPKIEYIKVLKSAISIQEKQSQNAG